MEYGPRCITFTPLYNKHDNMWKIFKTAVKLSIALWMIKSMYDDIGDEDMKKIKSVFKQIN